MTVSGGESGDVELTADAIILASGSVPRTIPGFDIDGKLVVTSDELLSIDKLPGSAVVIGGGAIGCEFASMMGDLGTKVTILEALPKILPGVDKDVTKSCSSRSSSAASTCAPASPSQATRRTRRARARRCSSATASRSRSTSS